MKITIDIPEEDVEPTVQVLQAAVDDFHEYSRSNMMDEEDKENWRQATKLISNLKDQLDVDVNNRFTITLTSVKDPDEWGELCHMLDVDPEIRDKYLDVGEYADLELTFDENLNLIAGKLLEQ